MVKILVVGNGGREHAIVWKLLQSDKVTQVICIPGNGGTAKLPRCISLGLGQTDFEGIARFCTVNNVGLVVVGPEVPLAAGITDYLKAKNITVFGPSQAGAQIEASKAWAKALMLDAKIPTAISGVFETSLDAQNYLQSQSIPIVIKADGLAAGKGVTVATSLAEATSAIEACFSGKFGGAGSRVVIEEFMPGEEASILAVTDGTTIRALLPAQDHKRIGEGDRGENTGGMGVYAPAPIVTPELLARVQTQVLEPAIATLKARGIDYNGILYAGLMISPEGDFRVVEFNCRFGDPETQAILPLLETPLHEVLLACATGKLAELPPLAWKSDVCARVVAASGGYPGDFKKGFEISGLEQAEASGAVVFHAGTRLREGKILTDGGRVFGVTATGETFDVAFANAYRSIACIEFEGMYYRNDIGHSVRSTVAEVSRSVV